MNYRKLLSTLLFFCSFLSCYSQNMADTSSAKDKALHIFVDCGFCDLDYLRTEVTFVDYVRDRKLAQVDIVGSSLSTGSGGTRYTLVFIGQKEFAGQNDTLKFSTQSYETDDGLRKKITQTIKLGLIRYVAKTPYAYKLFITLPPDTCAKPVDVPVKDSWRSWVFSLNGNSFLNGQELVTYATYSGNISISKVTPDWKFRLNAGYSLNKNSFTIGDSVIKTSTKSESFNGLVVRSISDHFSAGLSATVNSSTYSNIKLSETFSPGIEYSIFPYTEATHRQIRFLYSIYGVNTQCIDTTIYGNINSLLYGESLTATASYKMPWGSVILSATGSHYFENFSKNNLSVFTQLNLNVFQGFTINLFASGSLVHDQLFLPANGASSTEVLLQVQQLTTSYSYFASIGFTYTFGSIFNDVVNPRFGQSSYSFSMN
jgi:hypothetical protein